jgi:hypothetical protein
MNTAAMQTGRRLAASVLMSSTLAAASATAQSVGELHSALERLGVSGSIRAGYWSSTRDIDAIHPNAGGIAWLKAARQLGAGGAYFVEGWAASRGPVPRDHSSADLREAYVDLRFGKLDLRMGRQILAWGRADGVNPTDNLTPRDFTILVPDDHDRRIGSTGARATMYRGDLSFTALWLPEFRPNRIALPATPPGRTMAERFDRWAGRTWAVKVQQTGRSIDWSVSYARGPDLSPDLVPRTPSAIELAHHDIWVAGADAAANIGRFGVRAEAAFTGTDDADGRDAFTKNESFFAVFGVDRSFFERLNVNVQYLSRIVLDFAPITLPPTLGGSLAAMQAALSSQAARVQHGASSRVRYSWLHETLEAEIAGVGYFGPRGGVVAPKASYAVTDHWKVVAGAEVYRGADDSIYGILRRNSVSFAEVRFSF